MSNENVPNFGNLEAELEAVEYEVLPDVTLEVASDRRAVVKAFSKVTADRLELGRAINSYRLHFKASRSWLRIAEVLGRQLGRSRSTLYNVMHDAERALELTKVRRSALRAEGIEPAKQRYAPILSHLAGGPDDETPADARLAVRAAIAEFKSQQTSRKSKDRQSDPAAVSLDEFVEQEIARVSQFAEQHGELTHQAIADAMMDRIEVWAATGGDPEMSAARIDVGLPADQLSADDGSASLHGNNQVPAVGLNADRSESARAAGTKRPPAPAPPQQTTLFDHLGGGMG